MPQDPVTYVHVWSPRHVAFFSALLSPAGALGSVWGCRGSSSASPCEQERRRDWGHAELLEGELGP